MKFLVEDWKTIIRNSYTSWGIVAVLLLTYASDIIYLLTGVGTNPVIWTLLLTVGCIFVYFGRLIKQPKENHKRRKIICLVLVFLLIALSIPSFAKQYPNHSGTKTDTSFATLSFDFISVLEGKENIGYLDIVGVPTDCYGHIKTAIVGVYKSDAICRQQLVVEIQEYQLGLHKYFSPETKQFRLPVYRDIAYTSLAFNIGIRRAGESTATRRLNRGDIIGGCEAIGWWNRAGDRIVRGIVNRRKKEQRLCLRGL